MKKTIKRIGLLFLLCVIIIFYVPKGCTDWKTFYDSHEKYVNDGYRVYDILVDFSPFGQPVRTSKRGVRTMGLFFDYITVEYGIYL